jgi:hypothetical protein
MRRTQPGLTQAEIYLEVRELTETEHECLDAWNDQDCWRRVAAEMPERELVGAYLLVVSWGRC